MHCRKRFPKLSAALGLAAAAALSSGCKDHAALPTASNPTATQIEQKVSLMTQEVSIKIGEQADEFVKRYPSQVKINKQPAGLDFYMIDWNSRPRGTVKIEHGQYSFAVEDVLGIQTSSDSELLIEGFYDYTIFAGLSTNNDQGLIAHGEARDKLYAILKKIEQKGWRVVTPRSRPRLTGQDRLNYVLKVSNSVGLDTQYLPTLDEWMQIQNLTDWNFYSDGQYLSVHFKRERSLLEATKPGSYLITFTLTSETEQFRGYVESEDRMRWKTLLPSQLDKLKPVRAKAETALKTQGIKIDETYQDPPLPNLK